MASLVELPAELLSRIASHLFSFDSRSHNEYLDDSFGNLRLSRRYVESRTRYTFDRAAFTTRVVTLHAHSLLKLRVVSKHPRFGKAIKKLVFEKARHPIFDKDLVTLENGHHYGLHAYADYGVIELPKHGTDGVYPNDCLTLRKRVKIGLRDCLGVILANAPNIKEVVIEPNFIASFWLDSPSRQEQLDEQARRQSQLIISGETLGYESDFDAHDVENEDYDNDDIDNPRQIETYVYPDYLLNLAVSAAQRHSVGLMSLSSTTVLSSATRARIFVELIPALLGLRHLIISFKASDATKLRRMDGSALYDYDDGQPAAKSLGYALNMLRNLQSLELSFDDHYWEEDRNTNISSSLRGFSDLSFEHLTSVAIRDASFEGEGLYEFLQQQKLTLQRVNLIFIALTTIDHWRPILTLMLEDMLPLSELRCEDLYGGPNFFDATLQRSQSCCTIKSVQREDVLVALKEALDRFPDSS